MDSIQHKLDEFTKAFLEESSENAGQIIQTVRDAREEELAQAKVELSAEVEAYKRRKIREIRTREGSRVSAHLLENKKKLFALRQTYAGEIQEIVLEKVAGFTTSPEYHEHMKALLQKAMEVLGYGASITVMLRPGDMDLREELLASVSGVSVSFEEGDFALGGLIVLCGAKGLRIDLTIDEALGDAASHFAELSGIDLEQE